LLSKCNLHRYTADLKEFTTLLQHINVMGGRLVRSDLDVILGSVGLCTSCCIQFTPHSLKAPGFGFNPCT
jgi:hypothetical protein